MCKRFTWFDSGCNATSSSWSIACWMDDVVVVVIATVADAAVTADKVDDVCVDDNVVCDWWSK